MLLGLSSLLVVVLFILYSGALVFLMLKLIAARMNGSEELAPAIVWNEISAWPSACKLFFWGMSIILPLFILSLT